MSRRKGPKDMANHREKVKEALRRAKNTGKANEETMEELEALIAEQSKPENLPKWWKKDVEYQMSLKSGPLLRNEG